LLLVLAAAPAHSDEVYLTWDEAPSAVFAEAERFVRRQVESTPALRARVRDRLAGVEPSYWEERYRIATAYRGSDSIGDAIEIEEIGKHRRITFVVGIAGGGEVTGVAVMAYREPYGGEVRSKRFLGQYRGKQAADALRPGVDIRNVTGATLSARAIGRGVKKAIAVLGEVRQAGGSAGAGHRTSSR
jgi:hypothetical protein